MDVSVYQRREAHDIGRGYWHTFRPELLKRRFHIPGIPQHDGIDDQAQRPELVLLPLAISLPQFAPLPMQDSTGHAVAAFPAVELGEDTPAIAFIIHLGQHVDRGYA